MGKPVIVDAVRTPLGKRRGWLAGLHAARPARRRAGRGARALGRRPGRWSTQVIGGCVTQAGEQSNNMVRRAWLHAGLPQARRRHRPSTPSAPRASSPPTWSTRMIQAGVIDTGIACGVESMTRVPLGGNVPDGLGDPASAGLGHRPAQPVRGAPTGSPATAASPASRLDAFGLASQQKARVAVDEGRFTREIVAGRGAGARRGPASRPVTPGPGRLRPGPARHHPRGAGRPHARARGRHPHRRYVVPDLRRRPPRCC